MEKINRCKVQHFLLNFATYVVALVCTPAFTCVAWTKTDYVLLEMDRTDLTMRCRIGIIVVALIWTSVWLWLTSKIYRRYNIEQALRQSIERKNPYREALFKDWEWRNQILLFVTLILTIWGLSYAGYRVIDNFLAIMVVGVTVLIVGVIILAGMALSIHRKRLKRRHLGDQRIPMWFYDLNNSNGKSRQLSWNTVEFAAQKYWREG